MAKPVKQGELGKDIASTLSKQLKLPVYYDTGDIPKKISKLLEENFPEILKNITKADLYSEVSRAYMTTMITTRGKTQEKVIEAYAKTFTELVDIFQKGQTCTAYVFLAGIRNMPIGTKLGNAEIIEKAAIKFNGDVNFWDHMDSQKDKLDGVDFDKNGMWLKCQFKSYLGEDVAQDFYVYIQPILGLLSTLLLGFPIKEESILGVIIHKRGLSYLSSGFLGKTRLSWGWAQYSDPLNKELEQISELLAESKLSPIDKKILLSSKLFNLALQSDITETQFVVLVAALESLLLTKNDRDYLGTRLAEKTAFILKDTKEKRIRTYKDIKKLYGIRSDLVHGSKDRVEMDEANTAKSVYIALLKNLLGLRDQIKSFEDLDSLIQEMKFS